MNTVAVSPDGSLCANGGKDGVILLWDLAEGKRLYSLDAGSIIHALCFRVDLKAESDMAAEGTATHTNAGKNKV